MTAQTQIKSARQILKRTVAFLLCAFTILSVLTFADGAALRSFAAAETEPVVIEPTYTYKFPQKTYDKLLKQLNAQLKKKNFSKLAKKMLRDILYYEALYYPQWKNVYPDLPSTAAYIKENLINVIPMVDKIKLIDTSTPEGKKRRKKAGWVGLTVSNSQTSKITLFYDFSDKDMTPFEYEGQLSNLVHELRHVHDRKGIVGTKFPTETMEDIFFEGACSFHERFVLPMATYQESVAMVETSKDVTLFFDREACCAYPYFQCFFDGLICLAGYQTVDAIGKGKKPVTVKQAIAGRYGQETADTVWRILSKLPYDPEETKSPDKLFQLSVKFFQLLTDCMTKDIKKLDVRQPEVIRAYMDVFRNFKIKVLPFISDDAGTAYFDTEKAEQILIDKILASGALPRLYEDEALNRQAIREMLYCDEFTYNVLFWEEYLPPSIAQTKYTFSAIELEDESYDGMLTMSFKNERGVTVSFTCCFDEAETWDREADYPENITYAEDFFEDEAA